jgi:hypothetical protein
MLGGERVMKSLRGLNSEELGGLHGYCLDLAKGFADRRPALSAFWRELATVTGRALREERRRVMRAQRELHRGVYFEVEGDGRVCANEFTTSHLESMNWLDQWMGCCSPEEDEDEDECGPEN